MLINYRFQNRRVFAFNDFQFDLAFNKVASTFSFSFLFDPNNAEHKELACVSHYHEVTVMHTPIGFDKPIQVLKGMILTQKFKVSSKKHLANFSGYSLPGQLEDCTIPQSLYPLQSNGASLASLAKRLITPFNFDLVIDPSVASIVNSSYKSVKASSTQSIKDFLHEMSKQKDVWLSHDEYGNLLLTKAKVNSEPIFSFDLTSECPEGFEFDFEFNGQGIHREITVQKEASADGGNAGSYTITNPYVIGSVFRPTTSSQTSGDENNTSLAARRARANELRNIPLTISIPKWDVGGELIKPNTTIDIIAPELYIYYKTRFFIESVNYVGDTTKTTCTLNCVLPEVYNQETPVNIFRDINLHALEDEPIKDNPSDFVQS
jgi:prophage tail gpP-like protein